MGIQHDRVSVDEGQSLVTTTLPYVHQLLSESRRAQRCSRDGTLGLDLNRQQSSKRVAGQICLEGCPVLDQESIWFPLPCLLDAGYYPAIVPP